jgi:hypothetical protein
MDDGAIQAKNALAAALENAKSLREKDDVLTASLDKQTRLRNKQKQANFNAAHGILIAFLSIFASVLH